ncbi:major facilitator superfamily domain-containing protein [Xylariaceae sp. FL1651]|nr:major facilitator superfamily domain-containing protein [Xylariaceae sp. FL1651]
MSIELQRTTAPPALQESREENEDETQHLSPADTSPRAWKFLFGSFIIEGILWGFLLAFGVFQDYYLKQPEFKDSTDIPLIGAVATSIIFLSAPIVTPLARKFQRWQRYLIFIGSAICPLSLLGASFASSVPALIATQGVMYGLGFTILYYPVLRMLDEWFLRRRGLAYGLLYAGGGLVGASLPFLLEILLAEYGYRTTLRAVAVIQVILVAPILPLIKGRLPTSGTSALRAVDWSFLRQPLFWCFALSNLSQGLGYYIPSLFLPTFASDLGLSGIIGALILATNNLASVLGQVSFGYLCDRVNNVLLLVFLSSSISSIAAFTIWGLARSLGPLLAFALIYGWCAGAFPVFWQKFGSTLSHDPQPILSLMSFGKGVGNIVAPPIAARLTTEPIGLGYGLGKFQAIILFVGVSMFSSSLGIFGWFLKQR